MRGDKCPDCNHNVRAHVKDGAGFKCIYRAYADYLCPCTTPNPEIVAEDRLAGWLWRQATGASSVRAVSNTEHPTPGVPQ